MPKQQTKKYIVLDSNSIVSFFEEGFSLAQQEGVFCASEKITVLRHLLGALNKSQVDLILPEVVILECERKKEKIKEDLDTLYCNAIGGVEKASIPNKKIAQHPLKTIKKTMEDLCIREKNKIEIAWKLFEEIRNHRNTHIIELDERILLKAYKRGLIGKRPFKQKIIAIKDSEFNNKPVHEIQSDCVLVESVKLFLEGEENFELYLGTNDSDFYISNEKKALHPDIINDLKVKDSYLTLSDLLNKVLGVRPPKVQKVVKDQSLNAFPLVPENTTEEIKGENNLKVVKG